MGLQWQSRSALKGLFWMAFLTLATGTVLFVAMRHSRAPSGPAPRVEDQLGGTKEVPNVDTSPTNRPLGAESSSKAVSGLDDLPPLFDEASFQLSLNTDNKAHAQGAEMRTGEISGKLKPRLSKPRVPPVDPVLQHRPEYLIDFRAIPYDLDGVPK